MAITTKNLSGTGVTVKGSTLTTEEVDTNFITLVENINTKANEIHSHSDATITKSGYLSAIDKSKLDNIEENAAWWATITLSKADVGLDKVDNTSDASKPVSSAQATALSEKADKATTVSAGNGLSGGGSLASSRIITLGTPGTVTGTSTNTVTSGSHTHAIVVTKADVGLPNTDNTSDADKPISASQQAALGTKVDKVVGKGLSTEDFTSTEKNKLSGIESGAQVNAVPIDNLTTPDATVPLSASQGRALKGLIDGINTILQSDDTNLDELQEIVEFVKLNRETLDSLSIESIAGLSNALNNKQPLATVLTNTSASFTSALLTKLNDIASGATNTAAPVQSDWSAASGLAQILNKPTFKTVNDTAITGTGNIATPNTTYSAGTGIGLSGTVFSVSYGTAAGTAAQGNDSRINNGQTAYGWGNHASAGYATTTALTNGLSGKVDSTDSRLSDSREWSAGTVTQAVAEAGTSTDRFAWTAQRVRQAITAWWGTITQASIRTKAGIGTNAEGSRTVSTGDPVGGSDKDVWYKV